MGNKIPYPKIYKHFNTVSNFNRKINGALISNTEHCEHLHITTLHITHIPEKMDLFLRACSIIAITIML